MFRSDVRNHYERRRMRSRPQSQGQRGRVVQLTSPGSACSISFGEGIVDMQLGSRYDSDLVVSGMHVAHPTRRARGGGQRGPVFDSLLLHPSRGRDILDIVAFILFSEQDGNG